MASHALRGARLESARAALASAGAEWLIVPASPDFRWLTGASARVSERLVALALPHERVPFVVAPRLAAGNVHSAEPGAYLPGRLGVRLEDIVVIEANGARRLNAAPLDLRPPNSR